jgi:putative nucleotidyltransferase with HDIG domain
MKESKTLELTSSEESLLARIGQIAAQLSQEAYVVGGFVRDRLLQRDQNKADRDIDIVTVGDGPALAQAVVDAFPDVTQVNIYKRFGTAMIKMKDVELEFVGARKESYVSDSRKPEVEPGTLEDDQYRRDFTINAMAISLQEGTFGQLVDPFNGEEDLASKIIRTPLPPDQTFSDDPLRMMRAVRFAAQLDFRIAEETFKSIGAQAHRLEIVSVERIAVELQKIILSPKPSIGFQLLSQSNLLKEFFPEMEALHGVEERNGIRHKDNFYHTLEVLDNVAEKSDSVWLRWAAILHDIAKPPTKRFHPKSGWTFHGHDAVGAKMVPKIFKRLRLPLDKKMKFVQKLVRLHLRPISLTKADISDAAVRRLLFDAGDDIDELLVLCEADITSKNPRRVQRYLQNYERLRAKIDEVEEKDRLRKWEPPIGGEEIMAAFDLKPSRVVGEIKTAIREGILDGDIPNEKEAAWSFMLKKGRDLGLTPVLERPPRE